MITAEIRKLNIINWISTLDDDNVLQKVEQLLKSQSDWWDDLSAEEVKEIDESIAELDRGEYFTHSEVKAKLKKELGFK